MCIHRVCTCEIVFSVSCTCTHATAIEQLLLLIHLTAIHNHNKTNHSVDMSNYVFLGRCWCVCHCYWLVAKQSMWKKYTFSHLKRLNMWFWANHHGCKYENCHRNLSALHEFAVCSIVRRWSKPIYGQLHERLPAQ